TIEIESALVADASVQEAGAAGVDDALTGQAVAVFVIPAGDGGALDVAALRARVAREIGPIAKPRHVIAVPDLPRTRSGKIMRRLLAQLVHAERDRRRGVTPEPLGDVTSLQNPDAVDTAAAVLTALPAQHPAGVPRRAHPRPAARAAAVRPPPRGPPPAAGPLPPRPAPADPGPSPRPAPADPGPSPRPDPADPGPSPR